MDKGSEKHLEREKKFLVAEDYQINGVFDIVKMAETLGVTKLTIDQYYMMLSDKKQLRIRIVDSKHAFICYKANTNVKDTKIEVETEIPYEIGKAAVQASAEKYIPKTRYDFGALNGYLSVVVDVYENDLVIVEVEYEGLFNPFSLPNFVGIEVTDNKNYSNIAMARQYFIADNEPPQPTIKHVYTDRITNSNE